MHRSAWGSFIRYSRDGVTRDGEPPRTTCNMYHIRFYYIPGFAGILEILPKNLLAANRLVGDPFSSMVTIRG